MADRESKRAITEVVPILDIWEEPTKPPLPGGVQLVCVAGTDLGHTYKLTAPTMVIGRGSVDIALRSIDVSRNHARITREGNGFAVIDLGSSNGTFVNGVRVTGLTPLRVGDRLQIGTTIFVFAHHDELEERMRHLQRVQAMGTMAGGLAHDFNNALSVVLGNLELLQDRVREPDLVEMLGEMRDAAGAAAQLAQRLLRLGRTEPPSFEVVKLSMLVERALGGLRRQSAGKIAIATAVSPDLVVSGSYEELHQVLVNLFVNARDAMPDGGTFRVSARSVRVDPAQATARQLPAAGDYVELTITDSGCGMDEQTLTRIFEPFFTTKPAGHGTGLGLAMVHGIVRGHGGTVEVESKLKHGTTFRVVLPAAG